MRNAEDAITSGGMYLALHRSAIITLLVGLVAGDYSSDAPRSSGMRQPNPSRATFSQPSRFLVMAARSASASRSLSLSALAYVTGVPPAPPQACSAGIAADDVHDSRCVRCAEVELLVLGLGKLGRFKSVPSALHALRALCAFPSSATRLLNDGPQVGNNRVACQRGRPCRSSPSRSHPDLRNLLSSLRSRPRR